MAAQSDALDLEPAILVIFGITGDLARRKVLPAIYHLFKDNLLHDKTFIVGTSRRDLSVDELLQEVELCVLEVDKVCDPAVIERLRHRLSMLQVNPGEASDYDRLREHLQSIEDGQGTCLHRLFYLSIPPQVYRPLVKHLGEHGLNQGCKHGSAGSRLLVEKPFGYDLVSAEELIATTAEHFSEAQVYRIDHYLAKETAQNILSFRRHNPVFAGQWNNRHIRSIHVTAAEQIGIEGRGDFYEHVGALRDLVQSHLLQLLALTTMEMPADLTGEPIHAAKQALLESIVPMPADQVGRRTVRGQYSSYRDEVNNADSTTETFASLVLESRDELWHGVPLQLTTGKALAAKTTTIQICFGDTDRNLLTFRIQPDEGISLTLQVKKPGFADELDSTVMDFTYQSAFAGADHPDAYERVLVDAIRGDQTLFATSQEVLAAWRILQPVLDEWAKGTAPLQVYDNNSAGPGTQALADAL